MTTVNQGIVKVVSNNALGQPTGQQTGGTVVNANAELQISGNLNIDDEQLTLNGSGYLGNQSATGVNAGAVHVLTGSTANWGGGATPITLGSNGANAIGVDNGATLIVNGQFAANSNPLSKVGLGTLEMRGGVPNTNTGTITINDGTFRLNKLPGVGGADWAGVYHR